LNGSFILPLANAPVAVRAEIGVERTRLTPIHESDKEQPLQRHARRSTRIRKESYPHLFRSPDIAVNAVHRERRSTEGFETEADSFSLSVNGDSWTINSAQAKLLQTDFGRMPCAGNVEVHNRLRAHNGRIGPQMSACRIGLACTQRLTAELAE